MITKNKEYTIVFPGQGSQRMGMGMDFYEVFAEAREVFDAASRSLPFNVIEVIGAGDDLLNETKYTQPCILTVEMAMLKVLQKQTSLKAVNFGGHSLGEYTALVSANVIPFELAVSLVYQRGLFMQNSAPTGFGGMAAVIMPYLPINEIAHLASSYDIDLANDNSRNQVVLSGKAEALNTLCQDLELRFADSGMRIVPLTVSAPFHSRHMAEIEVLFREVLEVYKKEMNPTHLSRVVSNYTGTFHTGFLEDLIEALTKQLSARVRWRDNMLALREKRLPIIELGPHRPLKGFFQTMDITIESIMNLRSAQKTFPELSIIKQSEELRKDQHVAI